MQHSGSRPLAPAPPSSPGGLSESNANSPEQGAGATINRITRASTACQNCKHIKRKCDQSQPCSNCRKSHIPCVYNEADDGRRKAARKRTVESLELKRDALDSILESLRNPDDHHVQTLVRLIRSHAPLEDIVRYATDNAYALPDRRHQRIETIASGQPRKKVLSVNDLCDTPLVKVPSRPWTTVTDDDDFVSHLTSIYFTWFHVAYPVMTKHMFLQDMSNGRLDCQFCSPLLVNAMLSIACHFSDHPRSCKVPADPSTRGEHFLEEAQRLWNEHGGRPTLLNIQAVSILAVTLTLVGKDRLSESYLHQVHRMQEELRFKTHQVEARGIEKVSPQMRRCWNLTSRTTFLLSVGFGTAFMNASLMGSLPDKGTDMDTELEQTIQWFPYPRQSPAVTVAFGDLHNANYKLHEIGHEIQQIHFGGTSATQVETIQSLDGKLRQWKHDLVQSLILHDDSSIIKPPIMDLHLTYHWFRIILFDFIRSPQSLPVPSLHHVNEAHAYAKFQSVESAQAIADLCKRYAQSFGLKQLTAWMPQVAVSAAHSIIEMLSDPVQGPLVQDVFHELCGVLVSASRRWPVMKGHVRMLFVTADERGHKLPKQTNALLKFVALDTWGDQGHLKFTSSAYPNYLLAKKDDPRLAAMGDLLERWADFQVSSEGDEDEEHPTTATNANHNDNNGISGQLPSSSSVARENAGWLVTTTTTTNTTANITASSTTEASTSRSRSESESRGEGPGTGVKRS